MKQFTINGVYLKAFPESIIEPITGQRITLKHTSPNELHN